MSESPRAPGRLFVLSCSLVLLSVVVSYSLSEYPEQFCKPCKKLFHVYSSVGKTKSKNAAQLPAANAAIGLTSRPEAISTACEAEYTSSPSAWRTPTIKTLACLCRVIHAT